jgi:hypothetical protein
LVAPRCDGPAPTESEKKADAVRRSQAASSASIRPPPRAKKNGVAEHPEVFDHAGLLVNGPPGMAGLPFI